MSPLEPGDDPRRIAGIAEEFKMGFDALKGVERAVSIFGSARHADRPGLRAGPRRSPQQLGLRRATRSSPAAARE